MASIHVRFGGYPAAAWKYAMSCGTIQISYALLAMPSFPTLEATIVFVLGLRYCLFGLFEPTLGATVSVALIVDLTFVIVLHGCRGGKHCSIG